MYQGPQLNPVILRRCGSYDAGYVPIIDSDSQLRSLVQKYIHYVHCIATVIVPKGMYR